MFTKVMSFKQFLNEPNTAQNYEQYLKGFDEFMKNPLNSEAAEKINKVADGNWQDILKDLSGPIKSMGNFLDYIVHPAKIILSILTWTVNNSYQICVAAALLALILYIAGQKKALKYVPVTLTIYILLQAIGGYLK